MYSKRQQQILSEITRGLGLTEPEPRAVAVEQSPGYIDSVIRPCETRPAVTRALLSLRTKRETLPPKKHGNIPL